MDYISKTLIQFFKFGIIGLTNTFISYFINVLIIFICSGYGFSWDYIAGNAAGFFFGTLWSYVWNNKFVFKKADNEDRNTFKTLLKTYVSYGFTGIVLNNLLSYMWINIFGLSKYIRSSILW